MNPQFQSGSWRRNESSTFDLHSSYGPNPLINYQFGNINHHDKKNLYNQTGIFSDPGEDFSSFRTGPRYLNASVANQRVGYRQASFESTYPYSSNYVNHHPSSYNINEPLVNHPNIPADYAKPRPHLSSYQSDNDFFNRNGNFDYMYNNNVFNTNEPMRQNLSQKNDYPNEFLDNTYKKLLRWSLCDANNSRVTDKLYVDCDSPPEPEPIFSNSMSNMMNPTEKPSSFWNNQFTKVSTNPLSRWRNRIRKKYETNDFVDQEKSILKSLRSHNSKSNNSLLVQRLAIKEFERNRFLSKIEIDEFRLIVSSLKSFIKRPETSKDNPFSIPDNKFGLSGILCVQVIGAMGLQSNQSLIRDLYCVVELDGTRKARTMIKTNTECFLWQEEFEIEISCTKDFSLLLYQWNYTNKHRLCFYGNIDLMKIFGGSSGLTNLNNNNCNDNYSRLSYNRSHPRQHSSAYSDVDVHSNYTSISDLIGHNYRHHSSSRYNLNRCYEEELKFEKVALQLEPNGILYLELSYFPMSMAYLRVHASPSANYNIPLFGSPLNLVLNREKSKIPYVVIKCIQEIDQRGLDICGIYKICGSLKLKMQLRNTFELIFYPIKDEIDLQDDPNQNEIDLNPSKVPDIHVITAVLKDYLRELPEPLLTDGLYKMLLDAIRIKDQQSNTKIGSRDSSQVSNKTKLIYRILECIPIENQRVLFFILDHLKRVLMKSSLNKLSITSMGDIFGPLLFYPSPSAVGKMDQSLLQSSYLSEMFCSVLNIWPGQKKFHFSSSSRRLSNRHHSMDEYQSGQGMMSKQFRTSQNYERSRNTRSNQNKRYLYKQNSEQGYRRSHHDQ